MKTKLASDVTTLENKIDTIDKKIPDISGMATKTSLISYLQTSTFNSKVTEVENTIKTADIIALLNTIALLYTIKSILFVPDSQKKSNNALLKYTIRLLSN